jgi:hypothetical protein
LVNPRLRTALELGGGLLTVAESGLPDHVIEYARRTGQVAVPFTGLLMDPALAGDAVARRRAALLIAGPGAALSHLSALAEWVCLPTIRTAYTC